MPGAGVGLIQVFPQMRENNFKIRRLPRVQKLWQKHNNKLAAQKQQQEKEW